MRFTQVISILFAGSVLNLPVLSAADAERNGESVVVRIRLNNEQITPVTAHFITRAPRDAEEQGAQ